MNSGPASRFDRQTRFAPFGQDGQNKLEQASVFVLGTGALGGVLAQSFVRSGVGRLVFADRDSVEWSNLPRQVLFEEHHAEEQTPKAWAAKEALARIGGKTKLEAHAVHVDADNLPTLASGCDLILDGTDNLESRYLINDFAVQTQTPWVYAGVIGGGGLVMPVLPGVGPCLRCLFPEPPPPGSLETCDTAGVLMPAVGVIASMAAGLGLRLLLDPHGTPTKLLEMDAWHGEVRSLAVPRRPDCPTCDRGEFPYLEAPLSDRAISLCGRNTVQVRGAGVPVDLQAMAARLQPIASAVQNLGPLLRAELEGHRITLFADGRALIEGTEDQGKAIAIYDRYLA